MIVYSFDRTVELVDLAVDFLGILIALVNIVFLEFGVGGSVRVGLDFLVDDGVDLVHVVGEFRVFKEG